MTTTIRPFDEQGRYTEFHNYILDCLMPQLSPNAWKCLCFIMRKTKGWHKDSDDLSFSQIKKGTGIKSDPTISKALKELEHLECILVNRNPDEQWTSNAYRLNTALEIIVDEPVSTIESIVETTIENTVEPTIESIDTKETYKPNKNKGVVTSAKKPKPPKPPPVPNPAFDVFYRITEYPKVKNFWRNKMRDAVGDTPANLELWGQIVEAWIGKGWFEGNVKGMLEFFERREVPGYDRRKSYEPNPTKNGQNGATHQTGQDVHGPDEPGRAERIGAAFAAKARTNRPPP